MTGCVSDADLCREEESLPFVVFCAAGCRFGIEASQVQGSDGSVDASLLTVESLLGLPEDLSGSVRQCLRVRDPERATAFSVGVPVDLCTFSIREIFPLPPFIAARCRLPALLALVIAPEGLVCLMDVPGLLKARQVQGETRKEKRRPVLPARQAGQSHELVLEQAEVLCKDWAEE